LGGPDAGFPVRDALGRKRRGKKSGGLLGEKRGKRKGKKTSGPTKAKKKMDMGNRGETWGKAGKKTQKEEFWKGTDKG